MLNTQIKKIRKHKKQQIFHQCFLKCSLKKQNQNKKTQIVTRMIYFTHALNY